MSTFQNRLVFWSIVGAGVSSISVQLVTIREFLSQFQGNEITISLTLFSWLVLTALGSLLSKPIKNTSPTTYALLIFFLAFWPLIQLVLIRSLREALFLHGTSAGFYQMFFYVLGMIAPYCLVIGFILPHALAVLNRNHRRLTSGYLYLIDNVGDIAGGALFTFVLVTWLKPFAIIAVTSSLLIVVALLLLMGMRRYLLLLPISLCVIVFYVLSFSSQFELHTLAAQYGGLLRYEESPYGRIVITREGPQHTFWESGLPLFTDADVEKSEEKIHYPLSQLDRVRNVLLISGGQGEALQEVLKHDPASIDYVELDPHLTRLAEEAGLLKKTPQVQIINTDGRHYIKTTRKKYDAVIVDLPEPDTFQINRFFTSEFFRMVKGVLSQGGVFSFSSRCSPNYLSDMTRRKLSAIYRTALLHFQNVLVLPGGEAYFLCKDGRLWEDVPARLIGKSIKTSYVEGFFYGNVTRERIADLRQRLEAGGEVNSDFEPKVINLAMQEWFAVHGSHPGVLLWVLVGASALFLVFLRREEYLLFSSGLATMGAEMLVIFSFQVMYGFIYKEVGAIITAFLAGLLPGSFLGNLAPRPKVRSLILSDFVLLLLLLLFFIWISYFRSELPPYLFLGYCFVFSLFCGYQFPLAAALIGEEKSPAASCLAADLAGAGVGTLTVGALLVPLWGIRWAIISLILVKISSNVAILLTKRRTVP